MSTFNRLAVRAAEANTLFSVVLELTYRCNLDCFFCYNDPGKRGVPLTTERYLTLLDELQALDVLSLILSGGEPLAHPGFWAIARKAARGAFSIRIKTNGHSVDADVARRLHEEIHPFIVDVSLHGATPESHDRQTRVPGSFERLMRNLRSMREAGLHIKLNSTMTAWNISEIEGMHRIADDLGVLLGVNFSISPRDDGDRTPLDIAPSLEQMRVAVGYLESRDALNGVARGSDPADEMPATDPPGAPLKNCGVASSTLAIDPYGDVLPCVQWRHPVGNILKGTLREIWFRNDGLESIREVSVAARRTVEAQGPSGPLLAFCPALAEMQTGSPLAIYEGARDRAAAFLRPVPFVAPVRLPVREQPAYPETSQGQDFMYADPT